ncbi:MAG: hypothetical protein ACJ8GO_10335 [Ramlibacter sp.]
MPIAHRSDELLLAALREAPRPFLLPPLPADGATARASGVETALAFALEAARTDGTASEATRAVFTSALAELIRRALVPDHGDPVFQAQVLRSQMPDIDEYVRLCALHARDERAVRFQVDAVGHPGKLARTPPGALREQRLRLHELAVSCSWAALADTAQQLAAQAPPDAPWRQTLAGVVGNAALQRLQRFEALQPLEPVQRYAALLARSGPRAGSDAAADRGRAAARLGGAAERETALAFEAIAALLDGAAPQAGRLRVVTGLRTPKGFPGAGPRTKDEWDAALVRDGSSGAQVVLLAEVKAAPPAAAADLPQLLRGLQRLAQANPGSSYPFPSAEGEVDLDGATLRALQSRDGALPPNVIYCCPSTTESRPAMLSAAARSLLLAEPASIAFATRLLEDASPSDADLDVVWDAVRTAPRLRPVLEQDATARAARAAMLRPADLVGEVSRLCTSVRSG